MGDPSRNSNRSSLFTFQSRRQSRRHFQVGRRSELCTPEEKIAAIARENAVILDLRMRAALGNDEDSRIVIDFLAWSKTKKNVKQGSRSVMGLFAERLCAIHRRQIMDEFGNLKEKCCKDHHYLYLALRMTFDFQLQDKANMLLREIFLCEGSLEEIFTILQPQEFNARGEPMSTTSCSTTNAYTLYNYKSFVHRSSLGAIAVSRDRLLFEFFLKSIAPLSSADFPNTDSLYVPEKVLNLESFGVNAVSPLLAVTMQADLELILLLLRHGANPLLTTRSQVKANSDFEVCKTPVKYAVDEFNIASVTMTHEPGCERTWSHNTAELAVLESEAQAQYLCQVCQLQAKYFTCLTYFARTVYAIDIRESSLKVETQLLLAKGLHFEVRPQIRETDGIDLTRFRGPPSLVHACRCVVRKALSAARKDSLPNAIKGLPVPHNVQNFLDLLY